MNTKAIKAAKKTMTLGSKGVKILAKTSSKGVRILAKKATKIEPPQSINWFYSLGFKVGVFLLIKSFLILKHQYGNLETTGFIMVIFQFCQGLALIINGMILQDKNVFENPNKLSSIVRWFGWVFAANIVIFVLRETFNWKFFESPTTVNWFVDFLSSIGNGISEFALSILFWDCDIWGLYCGLTYFMTLRYVRYAYDIQKTPMFYIMPLVPTKDPYLLSGENLSENDIDVVASIEIESESEVNPPEH